MPRNTLSLFIAILVLALGLTGVALAQETTSAGTHGPIDAFASAGRAAPVGNTVTYQDQLKGASGGLNDGIHNTAASGTYTVKINNSQITATTSTIYQDSTYTTRVGTAQIAGAGAFGRAYTCVGAYDENYLALNSTCQP